MTAWYDSPATSINIPEIAVVRPSKAFDGAPRMAACAELHRAYVADEAKFVSLMHYSNPPSPHEKYNQKMKKGCKVV
jgi:hypothetical protein